MATGLYAVSYTITHGSSVLQTVDAESETFNSLFKSSKSVDGYRIVDVCVAACPNSPWASIDAAEGLHVQVFLYQNYLYMVSKCIKRNYTV